MNAKLKIKFNSSQPIQGFEKVLIDTVTKHQTNPGNTSLKDKIKDVIEIATELQKENLQ